MTEGDVIGTYLGDPPWRPDLERPTIAHSPDDLGMAYILMVTVM